MVEFLEALNKMKDLQIVRFFSRFFTEESLSPTLNRFKQDLAGGTATDLAKELFLVAMLLSVGAFIIDQVFYWTSPGQVDRARDTWRSLSTAAATLGTGVKNLAIKAKNIVRQEYRGRQ